MSMCISRSKGPLVVPKALPALEELVKASAYAVERIGDRAVVGHA